MHLRLERLQAAVVVSAVHGVQTIVPDGRVPEACDASDAFDAPEGSAAPSIRRSARLSLGEQKVTHSSTADASGLLGFSMTHSTRLERQRSHGGFSAPMQRILARRQAF